MCHETQNEHELFLSEDDQDCTHNCEHHFKSISLAVTLWMDLLDIHSWALRDWGNSPSYPMEK